MCTFDLTVVVIVGASVVRVIYVRVVSIWQLLWPFEQCRQSTIRDICINLIALVCVRFESSCGRWSSVVRALYVMIISIWQLLWSLEQYCQSSVCHNCVNLTALVYVRFDSSCGRSSSIVRALYVIVISIWELLCAFDLTARALYVIFVSIWALVCVRFDSSCGRWSTIVRALYVIIVSIWQLLCTFDLTALVVVGAVSSELYTW